MLCICKWTPFVGNLCFYFFIHAVYMYFKEEKNEEEGKKNI